MLFPPAQTRMRSALRVLPLLSAAVLQPLFAEASAADGNRPWAWNDVPRVVAVGDVHGNLDKLARLLTAAGLVDEELSWAGGEDHLVVAGDFLDRGPDDRALMDLLRRLERESLESGGRVHVLLGNHEVLNLFRDLRYVNEESYRDFADEESKADRRAAAGKFAQRLGVDWGSSSFREFNDRFPPGYFARLKALDPDGQYGAWLLGLPAMVKINGVAYTHGGLNQQFAALGLEQINRRISDRLQTYLEARAVLEEEGVVAPMMQVVQVAKAAEEVVEKARRGRVSKRHEAAETLLAAAADPILGSQGPLWYRGNSLQDERLERDILDQALELLDAKALVVAHSPTTTRQITSRFHGRLFRIDHAIGASDSPLALVSEQGEIVVLDSATRQTKSPMRESPVGQLGASRGTELSDKQLAEFLITAPVIATRALGKGSTRPQLVVLEREGQVRRGIFKTISSEAEADRYQHEVAAYHLDRALGLEMVPVTVARKLDGQPGSLQAWVDGALDLETAEDYNITFFDTADKIPQLETARVFDALIGNASRKPADILGLVNNHRILLIDHSRAFSTSAELPPQIREPLRVPVGLAAALEGLNRRALTVRLGNLLSNDQIDALLARRDKILGRPASPAEASP